MPTLVQCLVLAGFNTHLAGFTTHTHQNIGEYNVFINIDAIGSKICQNTVVPVVHKRGYFIFILYI